MRPNVTAERAYPLHWNVLHGGTFMPLGYKYNAHINFSLTAGWNGGKYTGSEAVMSL